MRSIVRQHVCAQFVLLTHQVAAFPMQVVRLEMRKTLQDESWGLKIRGTPSGIQGPTVFVSMVVSTSVSEKGGLKQHDRLLEVNDVDTRKMTYVFFPPCPYRLAQYSRRGDTATPAQLVAAA